MSKKEREGRRDRGGIKERRKEGKRTKKKRALN